MSFLNETDLISEEIDVLISQLSSQARLFCLLRQFIRPNSLHVGKTRRTYPLTNTFSRVATNKCVTFAIWRKASPVTGLVPSCRVRVLLCRSRVMSPLVRTTLPSVKPVEKHREAFILIRGEENHPWPRKQTELRVVLVFYRWP